MFGLKKIWKRNPEKAPRKVKEESLFFAFASILTAFLLGVSKIGRISTLVFIIIMFLYLKLLRLAWKVVLKILGRFIVQLEGAADED